MNKFFTNSRAKTLLLFLVFALFAPAQTFAQKKTGEKKIEPPKTETKTSTAGKVTQITDEKLKELVKPNGKSLLVNFWATWCDPCREEFPDLVKIENDYRGKIDVITISLDDITDINTGVPKFLTEMKAEMPTYLLVSNDEGAIISTISKDWNGGLPFTILYNEKGEIIYFKQGKFKVPELREKIDSSLLKGSTSINAFSQPSTDIMSYRTVNDYDIGKEDALRDISEGRLKYFTTGLSDYGKMWSLILKERYNIQLRNSGCVINAKLLSYNAGYNKIVLSEIKKKFGENILTETRAEAEKLSRNQPANVVALTLTKKQK